MIVIGTFLLVGIGTKLFSVSDNFSGFQLLVSLLSTAKTDLGFVTSDLPDISQLENHHFTVQLLRIKGTAQLGSGSWVFSVQLDSGMDAMLKLNESPNEVCQHLPPVLAFASVLALLSSAHALCASFSCCTSHVSGCHALVLVKGLICCFL